MNCYMRWKGHLYVSVYENMENDLLIVENAVVEVKDQYIKLSPLLKGFTFFPTLHYLIYRSEKLITYCDQCTQQTRSFYKFCSPCLFSPLEPDAPSMNLPPLLERLKKRSFYEADRTHFQSFIASKRGSAT